LNELDSKERFPYYLRSRRNDQNAARQDLLREIRLKLVEYGMAHSQYRRDH